MFVLTCASYLLLHLFSLYFTYTVFSAFSDVSLNSCTDRLEYIL